MLKQRQENSAEDCDNNPTNDVDDETCDYLVEQIEDCTAEGNMGDQGQTTLAEICQKSCCEQKK